jgi:hypothetical protein
MLRARTLPLSPARKITTEFLHHAQKVPTLPIARTIHIRELAQARTRAGIPITWLPIFIRAYALTAGLHPELRRAYLPYPWPRLYEHPLTICTVPIEREVAGERVVLGAKLREPESMPVEVIAGHLRRWRETPVLELSDFRQILHLGRAPRAWLRFAFWQTLNFSGAKRAKRFGTCIVSSMGKYGARQIHPLAPLTTYFSAGPVDARGRVEIRCIYDHRVMDDGHVCRALVTLEEILNTTLLRELRALRGWQSDSVGQAIHPDTLREESGWKA